LIDVKVSNNCYILKDNILFYTAYSSQTVIRGVRDKRKEGKVFDYTCGKKIGTVIHLKNGEIILSSLKFDTIHDRLNREAE
jgi:regulator of extracellular matrix RemA (YlzA/DUF370 family)